MEILSSSSMGSIWPMDGRFPLTTCMGRAGTSKDSEWSESFLCSLFELQKALSLSLVTFHRSWCVCPQAVSVIGLDGWIWVAVRPGRSSPGPSHVQPGQLQHGGLSNAVSQVWNQEDFSFLFLFFILVNCFATKRQRPYSQSLCNGWLLFHNRFIFTVVGRYLAQNFVIPYTTMLIHSCVKWKCSWARV